jgi:hypothetical protein
MSGFSRLSIRATLLLAMAGCSPTFDWRDVRFPEAGDAQLLFPCKPDRLSRTLRLAGEDLRFALATCSTGSLTFAFGHAELADAGRTGEALAQMKEAVSANLRARASERPSRLPAVSRLQWQGHKPDGTALQEVAVFAIRGRRVFQASVIGTAVDAELADTFLASLKLSAP